MNRKLRWGMIGGGKDAFIGAVHRLAAFMDGQIELVCGALSINKDIAIESGHSLFLHPDRIYTNYEDMLNREAALPEDQRMDFVSIVTPNFAHYAPAVMALERSFHVVIEKPITISLDEAKRLKQKVEETGLLLCLTHTYSGYPMVKHAREMVRNGALGKVRKIYVNYHQGWLSRLTEREGNPQAAWRTDPSKSGKAGAIGDIGTHAAHLAEYITGLKITEVCAQLNIVVQGRALDDDGNVLLKFDNGATGVLTATQIAAGEENNLFIKVFGENGGLEWHQQEPNSLIAKWLDKPMEIYRTATGPIGTAGTKGVTRTPGGHPEGYLEAFANIYKNFTNAVRARWENKEASPEAFDFPGVEDGIRGMAFIENVVRNSNSDEKWSKYTL